MEVEGRLILDLPLVSGTSKAGNAWQKKEYVLETFGNYPKKVKFDFFGDRVNQFPLTVGKSYAISYDIESREFNGRWYTDIRAYSAREIQPATPGASAPEFGAAAQGGFGAAPAAPFGAPAQPFGGAPAAPAAPFGGDSSNGDDLPF